MTNNKGSEEAAVRQLIEKWLDAARKCNVDTVITCYTPDVVAFDAIAALQFKGIDAYRPHWEECVKHIHGEMIMEAHEMAVSVSGDQAIVHYVSRCGCTDGEGTEQVGWMRATVCCKRGADGWKIFHEHYSMPIDPVSNQAISDATP